MSRSLNTQRKSKKNGGTGSSSKKFRASSYKMSSRELGGFPDSMRVTLRYSEQLALTSTTGATAYYVYRGNSPFDPNFTGTGGQPYGYDDWSVEYARFRVYGSTIRVQGASVATTAAAQGARLCVGPRHVSSSPADLDSMMSAPYARWTLIGPLQQDRGGFLSLTQGVATAKFLGMSSFTMEGDPDISSLVNTNPAHQWFWVLGQQPIDGSSTVTQYYTVTVDYDVLFWDRIETTIDLKYQRALEIRAAFKDRNKADEKQRESSYTFVSAPPSPLEAGVQVKPQLRSSTSPMLERYSTDSGLSARLQPKSGFTRPGSSSGSHS